MGESVKDYARQMAETSTGMVKEMYSYIHQRGESFEGAIPTSELPRSAMLTFLRLRAKKSWCWFNAQMLSLTPTFEIEYYEGVADNGVWIGAHAWNTYRGRVVDVTWEDIPDEFKGLEGLKPLQQFQYFGVKIPRDFVRKHNPIRTMTMQPLLFKFIKEE